MNNPLISVLIPVYNVYEFLPRCLDSVLSQSYKNIEVIVVDDGSYDGSEFICDTYRRKDKRVEVIHQKNQGQSVARNLCIDIAKGEYLVFVDSDDYVTNTYVEDLYNLALKFDCKITCSLLETFQEGTLPRKPNYDYREMCMSSLEAVELMNYQEHLDTWPVCKLYHKSIFDSGLRYPKGLIFEDFALTYLLFFECDKVAWCNKVDYYYLLRPGSTEGAVFSEKKMEGALNVLRSMEEHKTLLSPIIKSYKCRMVSFAYHMLLKMPKNYEKRYIFEDLIKRYRLSVLFDTKARTKARFACLASFCGFKVVEVLFRMVDKRR